MSSREKEPFELKKILFGSINRKITLLFFLVAIVAPSIGIYYFYSISLSLLADGTDVFYQQSMLLQTTAMILIFVIAIDAAIIGFFVSRSITKPITFLHKATQEIEKGNFSIRTDIKTNDEIEKLSLAFNKTTEALSKMDEERKQLDKAKTEFLSITSHELRTPITPMRAQLQMLMQEYFGKLTKKQKESIEVIMRNTERLDRIIEDFLEISRIEAARLRFVYQETDLVKTINDTIAFMTGFANEKNITLVTKTRSLPSIQADPDRISQILRNLLHNAIKFSPPKSTITTKAEQKDDYIHFSVHDQGIGMSAEDQISIFEPFFQIEDHLNRKHGGTGLGLAICRGIVEAQNGKIWVESTPGKGSAFYFTIPLTPVEEIKPIKVLFSTKEFFEKKIKEEFTSMLGPMGIAEFNELKEKHALGKETIMSYIELLENLSIVNKKQENEFKQKINEIFSTEILPEANKESYEGKEEIKKDV